MDQTADSVGMAYAMPPAPGASERRARLALAAQAEARSGLRAQRAERLARLRAGAEAVSRHGAEPAPMEATGAAETHTAPRDVAAAWPAEGTPSEETARSAPLEAAAGDVVLGMTESVSSQTPAADGLQVEAMVEGAPFGAVETTPLEATTESAPVEATAENVSVGTTMESVSVEATIETVPFEMAIKSVPFEMAIEAGPSDAGPLVDPAPTMPAEMTETHRPEASGPTDGEAFEASADTAADDLTMADEDVEALEQFLVGLVGALGVEAPPPQPARLAPVVSFERPAAPLEMSGPDIHKAGSPFPGAGDLSRLPGVGPGLIGALVRAGVPDLATLAASDPAALADALGAIARLLDLQGWIAFARAATAAAAAEAINKSA